MEVWIYRPDKESQERKINKNFVYNCRNTPYWTIFDAKNEQKTQYKALQDKKRKEAYNIKIEVPND